MRALLIGLGCLFACSNDVDPEIIPGGGIGGGEIDGEVNVFVLDGQTDAPIAGATVAIGDTEKQTDAKGLVTFTDVEGKQTIAVKADGYRSQVMVGANGANITMGLAPRTSTPEQATLSGTIAGWSSITVPTGHVKLGAVVYSQTDDLGHPANNLPTPNDANACLAGQECNWSVVTRTGSVTLTAMIFDVDPKGTADRTDDEVTVIGYATKQGITVSPGVNQSGLVLDPIEAGNLETVTIDPGTPPAALTEQLLMPGIEVGKDDIVQIPLFVFTGATSVLVPKRTAFGGTATYRLTAIAATTSGAQGAQSAVLRKGLTSATLEAGEWLTTPVNVSVSRTTASWDPVPGAAAHSITWSDSMGEILEITVLDAVTSEAEVPNVVALPASGTLSAKVNALGADFDLNDFSLEEDSALLWGFSTQPADIP